MKHTALLAATVTAALSLAACDNSMMPGQGSAQDNGGGTPASELFGGPVVAKVNDTELRQSLMDAYKESWTARRQGQELPEDKVLLNEMINSELVYQDAVSRGVDQDPEIARQIALQSRALVIAKGLQNFLANNPVTDEEMQTLYDERIGNHPNKEYKARHILLENEEDAKKAIADLDQGGDFVEMATERSTGPSGKQGGDLGWFPANRMVAEFSQAVAVMEPGSYSSEPVQTQFGWHVILLEEQRDTTPPTLNEVKDQLTLVVRNQKLSAMFEHLRKNAQISVPEQAPATP